MPGIVVGCRHFEAMANLLGASIRKVQSLVARAKISDSGLFLTEWYNQQNNDVRSKGIDPLSHYCAYGAYEGRDPNPLFDSEWYREVYLAGRRELNPLLHYLRHGARAGLRPHPMFDPVWYAGHRNSGLSPDALRHFLASGAAAGLTPDARWYGDLPGSWAERSVQDEIVCETATPTVAIVDPPGGQTVLEMSDVYLVALRGLSARGDAWTRAEIARARDVVRRSQGAGNNNGAAQPLVSVIMPVFNRQSFVGDAVKSVLDQRYSNFELIICDDGSTDGTVEAIAALVEADKRVTVLQNVANEGAAAARNRCLQKAAGQFFAYIDSDNIWHPCFLGLMIEALRRREECHFAYASYFDAVIGVGPGYMRPTRYRDFSYGLQVRNPYVDLNSLVHHSRLYEQHGGFDPRLRMLQDYDLIRRYTLRGEVLHVPIALNLYRRIGAISRLSEGNRAAALNLINAKYGDTSLG